MRRIRIRPRVGSPRRPADYDEECFCRACLDCLGRTSNMPPGADVDDAIMDFVLFMLRSGRWRDFDPRRGNVSAFVVRWFRQYVGFGGGYKVTGQSRGRTERARRKPLSDDPREVRPRDMTAEAEKAAHTIRVASLTLSCPVGDEILRAALHAAAMGNNPARGAAAATGYPISRVRSALREARAVAAPYIPRS